MSQEAIENTKKVNAALRVIESKPSVRDDKDLDLTEYELEDGVKRSTVERVVKSVPPVAARVPTDEELFKPDGLPNHEFLKKHFLKEGRLSRDQTKRILEMVIDVFAKEPNLLMLNSPLTICGDIHGQYYDLMKLFEVGGDPSETPYLFLGDYVDRGSFSFECLIYLYALKINFPKTFWLLRGNHECKHLTSYFTFKAECLHKYDLSIFDACCKSFNYLPLAAVMNNQYFCTHGGISPDLVSVQDVNKINRFREIPSKGLMCDLMWADPIENYDEDSNSEERFVPNSLRGCSYAFTYKAVCDFLKRNGLLSVIRAHEAQDQGYRMYKNTKSMGFPSLMTLFSAPNYLDTYKNKAAILKYGDNLMNIRQFNFSPHPYWLPNFMDVFSWSLPFVGEKVTEMLIAILNICAEEELDEDVPIIDEAVGKISEVDDGVNEKESPRSNILDEAKRRSLRNKIMAIAKVSRMYSVLREESEKVQYLKTINSGTLPKGALAHGAEGLTETLSEFEKARKQDLINERVPPKMEEMESEREKYYRDMLQKIKGDQI
ncbi:calcineurin catalytic subunit A [Kluyveromyces lactis]|uniref:Serine/threonine-protein phosphatase n=1 Tax=Kluyveromyces lactis (strain ATCC 8585 / CBS 2359 / DSM 70799 / NBRC 1267 / NRRL Y-1140 / WM37) TaxID=284590 RepID=Q6CWA9_KLULA|nr:uncharacterized protein KLLA0_B05489g [Kluyveromyces lactis]CAH02173.1 KLLA0B05489p [Kluyveromyces lactis]|eukprot:XP_451780.1 uncharacterized protein KLLA0_B05489g [Kluyveromyces lactis]